MNPESVQKVSEEVDDAYQKRELVLVESRKANNTSWRMIAEGALFGFLSMLVAEEPILNHVMPVSWLFFLCYLICRCRAHYVRTPTTQLDRIGRTLRIWAWILIAGASLVATAGQ
jgi:hypothetical protein